MSLLNIYAAYAGNNDKWRPFALATPASRVKAVCNNSSVWMQKHGSNKETAVPELPKSEPPLIEPPYEVIEFSNQQYTNATNSNRQDCKQSFCKCDLCGSTNARFQCDMCAQQSFCVSCDQMYHRHPKRQTHIRKEIKNIPRVKGYQPPLPPKGESTMAPVPPPRRNKRAGSRLGTPSPVPQGTMKKDGSLMGSLKRFMVGGRPPISQGRGVRNDSLPPRFPHSMHSTEFDRRSGSRDSGYLDWDTDSRHRSGSISTLNSPFTSLMQAQSMAQLNCPSCHHHRMEWDWNRSQMNLNAFQPWQGMPQGNAWHGSIMIPQPYRMQDMADSCSRRGSLHHHRSSRRSRKFDSGDSESDFSMSDDRKSRRRSSPPTRNISPAMSRRSRRTMASDTEDDTMSRKSGRRYKKRSPSISREPSPALSRKSYRKKYDDDDAISVKSTSSRRSRIPLDQKLPTSFLKKKLPHSSTDSDDELTSGKDDKESIQHSYNTKLSITSESAIEMDESKSELEPIIETNETSKANIPDDTKYKNQDWECEHCTYLNVAKSKVCDVCCKSRAWKKDKTDDTKKEEEKLEEGMKNLNVTTEETDKKKGDIGDANILMKKTASTGTSPPPQSISTQTYDIQNFSGKRNTSFSGDDYSDWKSIKRSNSKISFSSDTQSNRQETVLSETDEFSLKPVNKPLHSQQSIETHLADKFENATGSSNRFLHGKHSAFQPIEYLNALRQKQANHGMEIVKLLREAEQYQFSAEDLTAALAQCGETNPIQWLIKNWHTMIDNVATLATNYGQEQQENIVGTISNFEARAALRFHNGDIWSAVAECVRQRQRKYAELMSKGHFLREDVVTVLTANHGDMEAAIMELNKCQLKPYLMRIWGPSLGSDNESGDVYRHHKKKSISRKEGAKSYKHDNQTVSYSDIQSWLAGVNNNYENKDYQFFEADMRPKTSWNVDDYYETGKTNIMNRSCESLQDNGFTQMENKWLYKSLQNLNTENGVFIFPEEPVPKGNSAQTVESYEKCGHSSLVNENIQHCNLTGGYELYSVLDEGNSMESVDHEDFDQSKEKLQNFLKQESHASIDNKNEYSLEDKDMVRPLSNSKIDKNRETHIPSISHIVDLVAKKIKNVIIEPKRDTVTSVRETQTANKKKNSTRIQSTSTEFQNNYRPTECFPTKTTQDCTNVAKDYPEVNHELIEPKIENSEMISYINRLKAKWKTSSTNENNEIGSQHSKHQMIYENNQSVYVAEPKDEIFKNQINLEIRDNEEHKKVTESEEAISDLQVTADEELESDKQNKKHRNGQSSNKMSTKASQEPRSKIKIKSSEMKNNAILNDQKVELIEKIDENNDLMKELTALSMLVKCNLDNFIIENNEKPSVTQRGISNKSTHNEKKDPLINQAKVITMKEQPVEFSNLNINKICTELSFDKEVSPLQEIVKSEEDIPLKTTVKISCDVNNISNVIKNSADHQIKNLNSVSGEQIPKERTGLPKNKHNFIRINVDESVIALAKTKRVDYEQKQLSAGHNEIIQPIHTTKTTESIKENSLGMKMEPVNNKQFDDPVFTENTMEAIQNLTRDAPVDVNTIQVTSKNESKHHSQNDAGVEVPHTEIPTEIINHILPESPQIEVPTETIIYGLPTEYHNMSIHLTNIITEVESPLAQTKSDMTDNKTLEDNRDSETFEYLNKNVTKYVENNDNLAKISLIYGDDINNANSANEDTILANKNGVLLIDDRNKEEQFVSNENKSVKNDLQEAPMIRYNKDFKISDDKELKKLAKHVENLATADQLEVSLLNEITESEPDNTMQDLIQRCLSEGAVRTYDQAQLAVQLMQLKFDKSQSIDAASECSNIQTAITYLQQECQLCAGKVTVKQMISMLDCEHRCCIECAQHFFTLQITEKTINDCVCPFCSEPKLQNLHSDDIFNYFSNLDILLKSFLQPIVHELFQQKLRDRTLMQDPNFKWCLKCSSGFIAEPQQKRLYCPDCKTISCADCGKQWDKEHDGKSCEEFLEWTKKNDPDVQLNQHLEDFGVMCPQCKTKYILVKGGCMHLTCSSCKYEFCSDCSKPFTMGAECKVSDYCAKLGLHAHHPRNCLFYLRDKEPEELKKLLADNNVELNMKPSTKLRCNIQLQKETEDGLLDTKCGARVFEAGLCRSHMREYLSRLISRNKIETIDILTTDDLETLILREGKRRPPRSYRTPEQEYHVALYQWLQFYT